MGKLLYLSHRIPYPPDKGDKIRAWHMLERLARTHEVHLGCLVDDPADWQHMDALRRVCASVGAFALDRRRNRLRALLALRPGRPLTLGYFGDAGLRQWVRTTSERERIAEAFVFSSAMIPYVPAPIVPASTLDMVDIDSEKWTAYAPQSRWPGSWLYAREGRTLFAVERDGAARFARTLLVSAAERDRFVAMAPETAGRVIAVENGVDLARFRPDPSLPSPFPAGRRAVVFTGAMDYRPNVEAMLWFAREVMPGLRARHADTMLAIVGLNPAPELLRLDDGDAIRVTGRVPDTRPYLAHAALVVAPLLIARGTQNKVLEAMAMARPVLASSGAHEGLAAVPGRHLLVADGAEGTLRAAGEILDGLHPGLGGAAREYVERAHDWERTLAVLDGMVGAADRTPRAAPPPRGLAPAASAA